MQDVIPAAGITYSTQSVGVWHSTQSVERDGSRVVNANLRSLHLRLLRKKIEKTLTGNVILMKRITTVLLVLLSWQGFAQPQAPLTLAKCIELALKSNPKIQSKKWQVTSAEALLGQSQAGYRPVFSAAAHHSQFFYNHYNYREQAVGLVADWSPGRWLLHSAGAERNEISAKTADYQQSEVDVIRRVASLYAEILLTSLRENVVQNRLTLLDQHLNVANALWQGGIRTQLDVLQTKSARIAIKQEMVAIQSQSQNLKNELRLLINRENSQPLILKSFPQNIIEIDSLSNVDQVKKQVALYNPSLKMLAFEATAEKLRNRKIKADLLPNLQFSGGYVADGDPTAEGNYGIVRLGVQVPLFQWGQSKYRRDEIAATTRTLELQRLNLEKELGIDVERILNQRKNLLETYRLQQEQLAIDQQAFEIATANYQAGLITNLEYLTAQKNLTENQLQIQEIQLDMLLSLIDIYSITGQTGNIVKLQGE